MNSKNNIQKIVVDNEVLALFIKRDIINELNKTTIFTPDEWKIQVGYNIHKSGDVVSKHYHIRSGNISKDIGVEALYVIKGLIKIYIYNPKNKSLITTFKAGEGDLVIMKSGHKVEYLKDSILLQVKEGPYPGENEDKIKL